MKNILIFISGGLCGALVYYLYSKPPHGKAAMVTANGVDMVGPDLTSEQKEAVAEATKSPNTPLSEEEKNASIKLTPHWALHSVKFNMSLGKHNFIGVKSLKKPPISKESGEYLFTVTGTQTKGDKNIFTAAISKNGVPIKIAGGDVDNKEIYKAITIS